MANMGRYCKAYLLSQLRQFPNWEEQAANARHEEQASADGTSKNPRQLTDDAIVYLHESYTVTDGVFFDENILFDKVTDEWKEYCHTTLEFSIPDYVHAMEAPSAPAHPAESVNVAQATV